MSGKGLKKCTVQEANSPVKNLVNSVARRNFIFGVKGLIEKRTESSFLESAILRFEELKMLLTVFLYNDLSHDH
jgi:hypothetical protein